MFYVYGGKGSYSVQFKIVYEGDDCFIKLNCENRSEVLDAMTFASTEMYKKFGLSEDLSGIAKKWGEDNKTIPYILCYIKDKKTMDGDVYNSVTGLGGFFN